MGGNHGRVYFVVYSFHSLLASGAAGAGSVSLCVANHAAISNCRDRGARSFWAASRDAVASGKAIARAPADLNRGHKQFFTPLHIICEAHAVSHRSSQLRVFRTVESMRFSVSRQIGVPFE